MGSYCLDDFQIGGIRAFEDAQVSANAFDAVVGLELPLCRYFNPLPVDTGRQRAIGFRQAQMLKSHRNSLR